MTDPPSLDVLNQVTDSFCSKDHAGKKIAESDVIESLRANLLEVVRRGGDGGNC